MAIKRSFFNTVGIKMLGTAACHLFHARHHPESWCKK